MSLVFLIKSILQTYIDNNNFNLNLAILRSIASTIMATNSHNIGIKNSWSLLDFARTHGRMKVTNDLVNSQTGETFKSCAFVATDGAVTLVGFSSTLGELTPSQIAAQKDSLQVVELESGNYKLCADIWQDVDLGI